MSDIPFLPDSIIYFHKIGPTALQGILYLSFRASQVYNI